MKILPLMLGIMLFFTQCEKEAADKGSTFSEDVMTLKSDCEPVVQTLWAGAGQNDISKADSVGYVTATLLPDNQLQVEYLITVNGYSLTEVHLWVGKDKSVGVFPRQAAPGRFPYKANLDFGTTQWDTIVDLNFEPSQHKIYVSAHGVVAWGDEIDGLEGLNELLPEDVTYSVLFQRGPVLSYFETTVDHDGFLGGVYDGWCIDTQNEIVPGTIYDAIAYSSYGEYDVNNPPLPFSLFDKPENLPLINWIINQDFVGEPSSALPGTTFTRGDVQQAMWQLLEFEPQDIGGEGSFRQIRVDEIMDLAMEFGANFVPECGEKVVIILYVPNADPAVQINIIEYPVPCGGGSETVWAYGEYRFNDRNNLIARKWGWIFEVDCTDE